ncbi:unnamed protein product, partial [Urochloa humidicola]
ERGEGTRELEERGKGAPAPSTLRRAAVGDIARDRERKEEPSVDMETPPPNCDLAADADGRERKRVPCCRAPRRQAGAAMYAVDAASGSRNDEEHHDAEHLDVEPDHVDEPRFVAKNVNAKQS